MILCLFVLIKNKFHSFLIVEIQIDITDVLKWIKTITSKTSFFSEYTDFLINSCIGTICFEGWIINSWTGIYSPFLLQRCLKI